MWYDISEGIRGMILTITEKVYPYHYMGGAPSSLHERCTITITWKMYPHHYTDVRATSAITVM